MKIIVRTCIFIICACTIVVLPVSAYADSNSDNHAGVVIDTGKQVTTACITFHGSITGAQALQLAQADPVFQSFGGIGRAVCSLCGVGCPSGDSCLTCQGATFWNYFRAKSGTSSFVLSGVGAGSAQVENGDVEGWKFGVGQKPPFVSYNTICGIDVNAGTSISGTTVPTSAQQQLVAKKSNAKQGNVNTTSSSVNNVSTSVPVTVLGKTITRKVLASAPMRHESTNSDMPEIIGGVLLAIGACAAGLFLLRSARLKNKDHPLI